MRNNLNKYVRMCNSDDICKVDGLTCTLHVVNSSVGEELFDHIFKDISGKTLSDVLEEVYGKKDLHLPLTKDDVEDLVLSPNGELLSVGYTDPMAVIIDAKTGKYVVTPCIYTAIIGPESCDNDNAGTIIDERLIDNNNEALKDGEVYIYPYDFTVWKWCALCYFKAAGNGPYHYNATNIVAFKEFMGDYIESISETDCFKKRCICEQ